VLNTRSVRPPRRIWSRNKPSPPFRTSASSNDHPQASLSSRHSVYPLPPPRPHHLCTQRSSPAPTLSTSSTPSTPSTHRSCAPDHPPPHRPLRLRRVTLPTWSDNDQHPPVVLNPLRLLQRFPKRRRPRPARRLHIPHCALACLSAMVEWQQQRRR
jgi:hypothetical protein